MDKKRGVSRKWRIYLQSMTILIRMMIKQRGYSLPYFQTNPNLGKNVKSITTNPVRLEFHIWIINNAWQTCCVISPLLLQKGLETSLAIDGQSVKGHIERLHGVCWDHDSGAWVIGVGGESTIACCISIPLHPSWSDQFEALGADGSPHHLSIAALLRQIAFQDVPDVWIRVGRNQLGAGSLLRVCVEAIELYRSSFLRCARHPKNCGGKRVNEEGNSSILLVPIAWMEYPKIPKQHGFYWTLHFLTPHIFNQPCPLRPNPGLWTTCRWHGHSALQPPRPWRRASPRWHRPCARHAPPRSGTGLSAPSRSHSLRSDRWNKTEDVDSLTQNWKGEGNGRGITNEIPKLVNDLQPKIGI